MKGRPSVVTNANSTTNQRLVLKKQLTRMDSFISPLVADREIAQSVLEKAKFTSTALIGGRILCEQANAGI
jgi:hypothetical protein